MTGAAGEVFADTGFWIAMHNAEDEWHWKARQAAASLVNKRIITSEMVLVEFLNCVARYGAQSRSHVPISPTGHCERSVAISSGQRTPPPQRDRHVAALLAMTSRVR